MTAFVELAIAMDSPTFRALATGIFLILLVNYFIIWGFTIWHSVYGNLLIKPAEEGEVYKEA